jgi:hypothetical protein
MSQHEKQTTTLYSHHIFLFPFKWSYSSVKKKSQEYSFIEKTDLKSLSKLMKETNTLWKPFKFEFKGDAKRYNEWIYFYENVRESLFDVHDNEHLLDHYKKPLLIQYDISEPNMTYCIAYSDEHKKGEFNLELEQITLNFYATGIGILAFHVNNRSFEDPNDILYINEYGRRFYPQFLINPSAKEHYLTGVHGAFLAESIAVKIGDNHVFTENFNDLQKAENWESAATHHWLPNFISGLLGDRFINNKVDLQKIIQDSVFLTPLIDDRMFVMSHLVNDMMMQQLLPHKATPDEDLMRPLFPLQKNDFWYKYLFIDKREASIKDKNLEADLLEQHSYTRWIDNGQIFGMSRYSFVMLVKNSQSWSLSHFQSMYFQIVVLCLAQRASVLRFSEEATKIQLDYQTDAIVPIYHKYIEFINKIYFREVTAQEQGIELYDQLQSIMRLDRQIQGLDMEFQELHNFLSMQEETNRNEKLDRITYWGLPIAVASLVLSFFGLNYFGSSQDTLKVDFSGHFEHNTEPAKSVWAIGIIAFLMFFVTLGLLKFRTSWLKRSRKY